MWHRPIYSYANFPLAGMVESYIVPRPSPVRIVVQDVGRMRPHDSPTVHENAIQLAAVGAYPYQKNPATKLAWLVYKLHVELLKNYQGLSCQHSSQLADARCNITILRFKPNLNIVEDLLVCCCPGTGHLHSVVFPIPTVEPGSVCNNVGKS